MVTKMPQKASSKSSAKPSAKRDLIDKNIYHKAPWVINYGKLNRIKKSTPGPLPKAAKTEHLFKVVGEKLPFASLPTVRKHFKSMGFSSAGVYVAHDSMGCPRYIGRGNIFSRLSARKRTQPLELEYFSFYIVADKKHEREIETLLIRTAGFLLEFNDKKKRVGILPGRILDYEAGTNFYERKKYVRNSKS